MSDMGGEYVSDMRGEYVSDDPVSQAAIAAATAQSQSEMLDLGIKGKEVSPYLLKCVTQNNLYIDIDQQHHIAIFFSIVAVISSKIHQSLTLHQP